MTHVIFNPDSVNWSPFLALQQRGGGELQYFVGTKYQRGGGLLQNVARFLIPVASNLLQTAKREGISAGSRVLGDLSQGKALKETIQTHAMQGLENLAEKLKQCGKGKKEPALVTRKGNGTKGRKKVSVVPTRRTKRQIIDQLSFPIPKNYK